MWNSKRDWTDSWSGPMVDFGVSHNEPTDSTKGGNFFINFWKKILHNEVKTYSLKSPVHKQPHRIIPVKI